MAHPQGKEPAFEAFETEDTPTSRESGIARRGSHAEMADAHDGPTARTSHVAHSIVPDEGELAALDGGWGDEEPNEHDRITVPPPPSEPPTLRIHDPLSFDVPPSPGLPAFDAASFVPPLSEPAPSYEQFVTLPPSGPPTMRITASPASGQTSSPPSKPSSAPGYGYRASQRPDLCGEMKSRFADGDFSGALVFAEKLLESEPEHADAVLYAGSCRTGLAEAFLEELGSRDKVPYLLGDSVTLVSLDLDPAHGFVVAQIDGMATIDEIMDVCGQAEHETLRLLYDLLKRDVIAVR